MRKWFYAGAVVGGFLLLGAAPAHADVVPAPADGLTGLLSAPAGDPAGLGLDPAGLGLPDPLGGGQLVGVRPGNNSADLNGLTTGLPVGRASAPKEAAEPAGRQPAPGRPAGDLPATDVLGGVLPQTSGILPGNVLGGGLLGQLPLLGGLTPDGRTPVGAPHESGPFPGGVPLLGGLGGLLPVNEMPDGVQTLPAPAGLPAGGTDVTPSALAGEPVGEPVEDPRVHEEPVDDETAAKRTFSAGGRPVAGEDRDF